MTRVKGRSGHIGALGMNPQSPIQINRGLYRGEKCEGKGKDLYFQTQEQMIEALKDITSIYTPMIWNEEKQQYDIDFHSADILGI